MAFVFGPTGGIACGKSTVSQYFSTLGVGVVDADIIARDVVRPRTPGLAAIVREFGGALLLPDGTLNRKAMGAIVFGNPRWREVLETLLQPYIVEGIDQAVAERSLDHDLVCVDAALFLEYGMQNRYKTVVLVALPKWDQLNRLRARNNLSLADAQQRLAAQWTHEERVEHLPPDHYLLWNTGTVESLREQVDRVHESLRSRLAASSHPA